MTDREICARIAKMYVCPKPRVLFHPHNSVKYLSTCSQVEKKYSHRCPSLKLLQNSLIIVRISTKLLKFRQGALHDILCSTSRSQDNNILKMQKLWQLLGKFVWIQGGVSKLYKIYCNDGISVTFSYWSNRCMVRQIRVIPLKWRLWTIYMTY